MLDLDKNEEQVEKWFNFAEYPGERYKLRHVLSYEVAELNEDETLNLILLDWEGIGAGDKPLPCDEKTRRKFLASKGGRERFLKMFFVARRLELFYDVGELAKNLLRSQSGSMSSAPLTSDNVQNANHRAEVLTSA